MLVEAMLRAPLVAIQPGERVFHAVGVGALAKGWPDGPGVAPCGAVVKLLGVPFGSDNAVEWPPRVSSLPDGWTRCRECHDATGKMRPRATFALAVPEKDAP